MSSKGWDLILQPLIRKVQSNPSSVWFFLGLIGLGLLMLAGSGSRSETQNRNSLTKDEVSRQAVVESPSAEQQLEREITQILQQISGVGNVRVDVSLKTANRKIWERQTRTTKRISQQQGEMNSEESSSDELVFAKNREGTDLPILKEDLAPEVQGVLVVAAGARDSDTKRLLTETVMTILDLPAHRVMVIAGKDELP